MYQKKKEKKEKEQGPISILFNLREKSKKRKENDGRGVEEPKKIV